MFMMMMMMMMMMKMMIKHQLTTVAERAFVMNKTKNHQPT
jgi:uncharacterized membrane protein YjgN (DUF898 family)